MQDCFLAMRPSHASYLVFNHRLRTAVNHVGRCRKFRIIIIIFLNRHCCKWIEKVNFPPCLWVMQTSGKKKKKRGNPSTTRAGEQSRVTASFADDRTASWHTGETPEEDHAASASSVWMRRPASGWRSSMWCGGTKGEGADGGTTWKPCIQKERRAERVGRGGGDQQPTDGKVRGHVGRGWCGGGGGYKCFETLHCAAKYKNNWAQH